MGLGFRVIVEKQRQLQEEGNRQQHMSRKESDRIRMQQAGNEKEFGAAVSSTMV